MFPAAHIRNTNALRPALRSQTRYATEAERGTAAATTRPAHLPVITIARPLLPRPTVLTPPPPKHVCKKTCGYADEAIPAQLPGRIPIGRIPIGERRKAAMIERVLNENPKLRAAFEAAVGGKLVADGRMDGVISIARPGRVRRARVDLSSITAPGSAGANLGWSPPLTSPGGLPSLLASKLAGFLGGQLPGDIGAGTWNPGARPGPATGADAAHASQVAGILADPSLTVEDKVTLMLMAIMKKMDRDILAQGRQLQKLQGGQGDKKGASIDVETTKLKRLIDKRGQMFGMLRQIIDKYNETAKGMIQSIGR